MKIPPYPDIHGFPDRLQPQFILNQIFSLRRSQYFDCVVLPLSTKDPKSFGLGHKLPQTFHLIFPHDKVLDDEEPFKVVAIRKGL